MNHEAALYLNQLASLREDIRDVLMGLTDEGLNWNPVPSASHSIFSLAQQAAWAEHWLIGHQVAGNPFPYDWRYGQALDTSGEDAADLLFWLDEAATATKAVLTALTSEGINEQREIDESDGSQQIAPLGRPIMQAIVQYAEHLGQMRLLRQLWEAQENG